jgi:integrase
MTKRRRRPTSTDPTALVVYETVLALEPEVLHSQAEASVKALLREGEAVNTVRSYGSALRYWAAWFQLRYRMPLALPVPVPAVLQFLVDHVERTTDEGQLAHDLPDPIDRALVDGGFKGSLGVLALNTVLHRLSVLSKAHLLRQVPNPMRDAAVQELVRRIRRVYAARGVRPASKKALTRAPLEAMLATCTDGMLGVRDRAVLLFGFASGGRRRSEIAAAVVENLVRVDGDAYLYHLSHTKTDQAGAEGNVHADKPIVGPAAEALTVWLGTSGVRSGPLFRRIRRSKVGEGLSGQAVALIVKRRARLAGLEGNFGGHSLRSGFATEAGRQNVPVGEAMGLTGHRSLAVFLRYFQPGAALVTRAANLLEGVEKSS